MFRTSATILINRSYMTFCPFSFGGTGKILCFRNALRSVLQATKCSNDLPATGDDFDYYSSFQGVRDVLDIEGKRILHIIQSVLKYQNVKGNLSENSDAVEVEDKFDVLIDANDQILERVGNWLDEASGVKKDDTTLVIATATPKHGATASWNKKSPAGVQSRSMTSYRLLAARNVQRPQLKFKDKIDNSNRPFVPIIKHKPNALKSLEESLQLPVFATDEVIESPEFQYPHPYQFEIQDLTPLDETLSSVIPQMPKPLNDTPVTIINKVSDLVELCETLRKSKEIAIDLEHHSYRTYQGVTCLTQISTRDEDFLIDTLDLRSDMYLLNDVFTDPSIVKVLHGAEMDVCWLQRDFGLYIVNMFDTGQAARVMNFSRFSLSHLLKQYCNVDADKQYQLADWRIRPLPEELVKYAREDTHYLLYIYDKMKNELIDRGNEQKNLLKSVIQRSNEVTLKVYKKAVFKEEEDYLELYRKTKKIFNSQQLSCLKKLFSWRDKVARMEDESTGYVLPNHMLMQIAEILPRERQGVFACCNPIPPLVRQYLIEIHDIVKESRETPLVKVEPLKQVKQPSSHHHPKYDPDSMLNCPHDMSHQSDKTVMESTLLDSNLIATSSSMFGSNGIPIKQQPSLGIFSQGKREKNGLTAAQRLAAGLKATFCSPFEQYFPSEEISNLKNSKIQQKTLNNMSADETDMPAISWKLLRNTVKRKEREPSPPSETAPVQEPPPKRQKVEVRDTGQPLISVGKLKGKAYGKRKTGDRFGMVADTSQTESQSNKGQKRKLDNVEEDQFKDFKPYDYSKADMKMFQGDNSQKNKNVFDPDAELRQKGKGHKGHKSGSSKSKKSYYGGQGSSSHAWPKK